MKRTFFTSICALLAIFSFAAIMHAANGNANSELASIGHEAIYISSGVASVSPVQAEESDSDNTAFQQNSASAQRHVILKGFRPVAADVTTVASVFFHDDNACLQTVVTFCRRFDGFHLSVSGLSPPSPVFLAV